MSLDRGQTAEIVNESARTQRWPSPPTRKEIKPTKAEGDIRFLVSSTVKCYGVRYYGGTKYIQGKKETANR